MKEISLFNSGTSYTRCYADSLSLHAIQQSDGRIESTFDIFNAVSSGFINKVTFSSDNSKGGASPAGYYNYYVSVRHAKTVDVSHGTAMPDAYGNPNLTYFSGSYTDCGNVNVQCAAGHEAVPYTPSQGGGAAGGVSYLLSFNRCDTASFSCEDMHESRTQGSDATVSISVIDVKTANIKYPSAGDITVIDNYSTGGRLNCYLDYHAGLFNLNSKRGVYEGGTYALNVTVGNAGSGGSYGGRYYFSGSTSPFALVGTNVIANITRGNAGQGSVQNGAYEVRGMIGSPDSTIEQPYYSGSSQYYGGNGAPIPGYSIPGTGSNRNGIYLGDYWQNGISTS